MDRFSSGVLDALIDGVIIIDEQGVIRLCNQATEKIFGYLPAEIIGQPADCLLLPPNAKPRLSLRMLNRHTRQTRIMSGRRKDGTTFPMELSANTLDLGDGPCFVVSIRDITARYRAQAEIRSLSEAVRQSPVVVVVTDALGNITYASPRFFALTGYTSEEVLGKNTRLFKSGLHKPIFYQELWETISKGKVWRGIFQNRKKNGEIYFEQASISSVRNLEGKIAYYIAVKEDITSAQKQQTELALAKERAERANQAKGQFLANISHEIRTPLNAIIGFSHLALDTDLTHAQRDYLQRIDQASQALLKMVNDVLDFSKMEASRMELENQPFRLNEQLEQTASIARGLASAKGLAVEWSVDRAISPILTGDALRLRQVLFNLTSNAVEFTERGKISIRVVLLERNQLGEQLRFSVSDTGIGISEEARGRIFEAFTQGDSSTTRRFGGTGLGLTITERLVKMMGGSVSLESKVGQGSTFSFTAHFQPGDARRLPSLDREAPRAPGTPAATPDGVCQLDNFSRQLAKLHQLVKEHDGEAFSLFQTMLPQFSACGVTPQGLEQALRTFSFAEADRLLTTLRGKEQSTYE